MSTVRFLALAALAFALDTATAGWIVELENGKTIVADDFWYEGDTAHCLQNGRNVTVEKASIVSAREGDVPALKSRARARMEGTLEAEPVEEIQELQANERRIADHMLDAQAKLYEAQNRGDVDDVAKLRREFTRTQKRWRDADTALREATNNERRPERDDWVEIE